MLKLIEKYRKFLKITILIATLFWMGLIFYFSSQPAEASLNASGKVLVSMDKLEKEEVQNISDRRVWNMQNTIRKYAHFIVYFILGFLMVLSSALIWGKKHQVYLHSWLAASLYGATDELHQYYVPGRGATLTDIGLDMASALVGTAIGIGIITIWSMLINRGKSSI